MAFQERPYILSLSVIYAVKGFPRFPFHPRFFSSGSLPGISKNAIPILPPGIAVSASLLTTIHTHLPLRKSPYLRSYESLKNAHTQQGS